MTSDKYPKWTIEKTETGNYVMYRPDWEAKGIMYTVAVEKWEEGWTGILLTYNEKLDGWYTPKNQYNGTPAQVVTEAERRAAYWMSKR